MKGQGNEFSLATVASNSQQSTPPPMLENTSIRISKPLSERLKQFLEQLDLSLRQIDAGML
ncbi:MAG: hypothetical protein RLZZ543_1230 [Bacteroidota bacterium]|jgi:hypothetical protein